MNDLANALGFVRGRGAAYSLGHLGSCANGARRVVLTFPVESGYAIRGDGVVNSPRANVTHDGMHGELAPGFRCGERARAARGQDVMAAVPIHGEGGLGDACLVSNENGALRGGIAFVVIEDDAVPELAQRADADEGTDQRRHVESTRYFEDAFDALRIKVRLFKCARSHDGLGSSSGGLNVAPCDVEIVEETPICGADENVRRTAVNSILFEGDGCRPRFASLSAGRSGRRCAVVFSLRCDRGLPNLAPNARSRAESFRAAPLV